MRTEPQQSHGCAAAVTQSLEILEAPVPNLAMNPAVSCAHATQPVEIALVSFGAFLGLVAIGVTFDSKASAFLINTPAIAPRPVPTMIDIGVANPNAQGQAIIKTATALTSA